MKIPLLEISTTDSEDSHFVHCVFCGHQQDPENGSYCQHVAFIYLRSIDEFEHISEEYIEQIEKIKKDSEDAESILETVEDQLLKIQATGRNYIVELSSSGIACGPSSFTVLYGFDGDL